MFQDNETLRIQINDLPAIELLTPEEQAELFGAGPKWARLGVEVLEERLVQASHLSFSSVFGGQLTVTTKEAGLNIQVVSNQNQSQVSIIEGGQTNAFSTSQVKKILFDTAAGTSAIDALFAGAEAMSIAVEHPGTPQSSYVRTPTGQLLQDGTTDLSPSRT